MARMAVAGLVAGALAAGIGLSAGALATTTAPPATAQVAPDRAERLAAQLSRERASWRVERARIIRGFADERRIAFLVRHPSQRNNRELARILFSPSEFVALDRIAAGGDGIGGAPGESDWHHDVWNGGKRGFDGGNPGPRARSCGGGNYAYGIGQACPGQKMISWAGTPAVTEVASMQLHWMKHYAENRPEYGSLEAAGAHWNIRRSW